MWFFIHGGPGLNASAEKSILEGFKDELYLWNEPNRARNSIAPTWENYLKYLEEEFEKSGADKIISHSFGALGTLHLANKFPDKVTKVTLLAPALNIYNVDANILNFCISDFKSQDNTITAKMLSELVETIEPLAFGPKRKEALTVSLGNAELLTHYFDQLPVLEKYASHLTGENEIDVEAFFEVRAGLPALDSFDVSKVEARLVYYNGDQLVQGSNEEELGKLYFPNCEIENLDGSHFAHLEDMGILDKLLKK